MNQLRHHPWLPPRPTGLLLLCLLLLFSLTGGSSAQAAAITFEQVMEQAIRQSLAIKIAQSDIAVRRLEVEETRSLYLPTLSLRYDNGHSWSIANENDVVAIGESVSASTISTWRNSLDLSAGLLLYDFGAREQKGVMASHRLRAAEFAACEQARQVRHTVLDSYLQGLQAQTRLRLREGTVSRRRELFRAVDRLRAAGIAGQVRLEEVALLLAAELTRLDEARAEQARALAALRELTGEEYQAGMDDLNPLPDSQPIDASFPLERLPQIRVVDEELARLRAERSAVRRKMLPDFELAGNYRLYGADRNNPGHTLEELTGRDAMVAVVVRWEFFSGFRDQLQLAKIDEQISRLGLERRQRLAGLEREIGSLRQTTAIHADAAVMNQRQEAVSAMGRSGERLREQGILDQVAALEREIDLLEETLEAEILRLRQKADVIRLGFWQEEGS